MLRSKAISVFCLLLLPLMAFAQVSSNPVVREKMEYAKKYSRKSYGQALINPYYPKGHVGAAINNGYLIDPVYLDEEFTFQKLVTAIDQGKITTIESVIDVLPSNMKNDNYVLMYRSRSLQEATPEAPRAILYTPTAKFILSFNGGGKNHRGSQSIETIEFNRDTKKFEFREIEFDGKNRPRISQANPSKCLQCHQAPSRQDIDMRPNWEPYSVWIGAYGSDGGDFSTRTLKQSLENRVRPQDAEALEEQAKEFDHFKKYVDEVAPNHPRYSKLGHLNIHATVALTEHLSIWNTMRVLRLMYEQKEAMQIYGEIFPYLFSCYAAQGTLAKSDALKYLASFQYPQYFEYGPPGIFRSTSTLITSLFEPIDVNTEDWSMDFGTGGRFALYQRFGTPSNTENLLKAIWSTNYPFKKDFKAAECEALEKIAFKKVDEAYRSGAFRAMAERNRPKKTTPQEIVKRCASCHTGPSAFAQGTPEISFDDLGNLKLDLEKIATTHKRNLYDEIQYRTSDMAAEREQMPPGKRLSAEERNTLMQYLKEIKK